MANPVPCPNPTCTHVFAPEAVQAASALKCPRCGFVFQLRAQPAAPGKAVPASPRARPAPSPTGRTPAVTAPAVAQPVRPALPVKPPELPPITPVQAVAPNFDVGVGDAPIVRTRPVRHSWSVTNWIILAFGVLALGGILVGAYFAIQTLARKGETTDVVPAGPVDIINAQVPNLKNTGNENVFKLLLPKNLYAKEGEIKTRLGAITAWKHEKEDFWFAVAVKDYGMYRPRDAELLDRGIEKLEQHFGADNLELAAKAEPAKLGDLPALSLTFKASHNALTTWGELILLAHHGFGYWVTIAAPTKEEVKQHWTDFNSEGHGFKIATDRKGWREQPTPKKSYLSPSGGYTLRVPEGVWEKQDVSEIDERGDLFLLGRFQKEKDNRKNASILITKVELRKGDLKETMKAARDYYDAKKMEEKYVVAAVEGQPESGVLDDIGNRKGRMIELKLSLGEEPKRYALLAVTGEPYLIQCDCTWESRQIWRQDFLDLLRTVNFKKGVEDAD